MGLKFIKTFFKGSSVTIVVTLLLLLLRLIQTKEKRETHFTEFSSSIFPCNARVFFSALKSTRHTGDYF